MTEEGFRLSPQQRHLWRLQEAHENVIYRVHCAVLIEGHLDSSILGTALKKVVDEHEILRTVFFRLPELKIPLQALAEVEVSVQEYELGNEELDKKTIESHLQQIGQGMCGLQRGPLFLISLLRNSHQSVLLLSLPALCADAMTLKNLIREIVRCYESELTGARESGQAMQYIDFCEWQNDLLDAKESEVGRRHWARPDYSLLSRMRLPFEMQTGSGATFFPASVLRYPEEDLRPLFSPPFQELGVSIPLFLLGCWCVLLSRLNGETNLIIGREYDGRGHDQLKHSLGLFAKCLPLQCCMDNGMLFKDILRHLQQESQDALRWQDCFAWEPIAEKVVTEGAESYFPFCFAFEEREGTQSVAGLKLRVLNQYCCNDRYGLMLRCVAEGNKLIPELYFDPGLYREEDIHRLRSQFRLVVEMAIKAPGTRVGEFGLLTAEDRNRLQVEFNNNEKVFSEIRCVHQVIEEQARRESARPAVVYEDRHLTYQELNARANYLAQRLREQGAGADALVGICMERSLEMIVAMLGILKAGAAYVPLDPLLPPNRLAFMLEEISPRIVVTHPSLKEHFANWQTICVDLEKETTSEDEQNPTIKVSPGNLVYALFTSGSTGRPKAVGVEHRQLFNYVHSIVERLEIPPGASYAMVSTFAADLGNTAIFPALCSGGCLHLISQERASDGHALAMYFERNPVDFLKIVPSHMEALLSLGDKKVLPRKGLVFGGERAGWNLIDRLGTLAPDCQIFNHYGPTETTVGVTACQLSRNESLRRRPWPSLGRPLANVRIYILDAEGGVVPFWAAGELYIGGASLARGYLGRPDLTAEKFVPDSFSIQPGSRLYQTGDLARWTTDGTIEWLGRKDNQIKIRGFRIELEEVEAVFRENPRVDQAVVVRWGDTEDSQTLVAYLTLRESSDINFAVSEIQKFMRERVPAYMVPSIFEVLEKLPLNANGKINRKTLPAPSGKSFSKIELLAPRTSVERILAGIWKEILRREEIGIQQSFFELGGHSLLATQVISRARQALGIDLPLRWLFETPTIAGLAEKIETLYRKEGGSSEAFLNAKTKIEARIEGMSPEEIRDLLKQREALKRERRQ